MTIPNQTPRHEGESVGPDEWLAAQNFVDHYSFAGYSNGMESPAGQPVFWDTQTFPGGSTVEMSDQDLNNRGVEPRPGTCLIISRDGENTVNAWSFSNGGGLRKKLMVSQHTVDLETGTVTPGSIERLVAPWFVSVAVPEDGIAKVVDTTAVRAKSKDVGRYDELTLDERQRREFGLAQSVILAVSAVRGRRQSA